MDMNENMLDELLRQDDVPPMPADAHNRWVQAIAQAPQQKVRLNLRTAAMRTLATAAAAVFVLAGAITAGNSLKENGTVPMAAEGAQNSMMLTARNSSAYDTATAEYAAGGVAAYSLGAAPEAAETDDAVQRKIIRNVSLTIMTQQYDESLNGLRDACVDCGGWVASTNEYDESDSRRAYLTLRIPAQELDSFLSTAGSAGRITRRDESAEDVTESYYDTKARLETQQALMDRLTELVGMADSMEDILVLESQMAQTQYEIERLQTSLNRVDRQVDYATVEITLREEKPAEQAVNPELTLGQRLMGALTAGAEAFAAFMENAAVYAVCALPFLAVVGAVWVLWKMIRNMRKRKG